MLDMEATNGTEENLDIEDKMNWVAEKFKQLFQGIGRYKGPPVHIWVKPGARSAKEHPASP